MEIGCGTGQLTNYLSKFTKDISGIDYDAGMIDVAKKSYKDIDFSKLDMRDVKSKFSNKKFKYIFCMGNTLVHLKDAKEIETFLKDAKSLLTDDGVFILQILNYQKIMSQNIKDLPLIENENIKFEREYKDNKDGTISFDTRLTIKNEDDKVINNSVKLYPLKHSEILDITKSLNFKQVEFYANFIKDKFDISDSLPLIAVFTP